MTRVDGDLVLMDARQNQYFCIARDAARDISADLVGGNRFHGDAQLLHELEAAGLYGPLDNARIHNPVRDLAKDDVFARDGIGVSTRMVGLLGLAWVRASVQLVGRKPVHWFDLAQRRRTRFASTDRDQILVLASAAYRARALAPGTSRCLPNSMLLLELLALHRLSARWVFGVRTHPFEAHCWVEHEGTVLNDSLDHVRWYTPIFAT